MIGFPNSFAMSIVIDLDKISTVVTEIRVNGELHSEAEPALVYQNGVKLWYLHGKFHRDNGPAIEYPDGSKGFAIDGELHRLDGPAFIYSDGSLEWRVHGQLHRTDGPAIVTKYESQWWVDGKRHREDGPAIELNDGDPKKKGNSQYYLQNIEIISPSTHDFLKLVAVWKVEQVLES